MNKFLKNKYYYEKDYTDYKGVIRRKIYEIC